VLPEHLTDARQARPAAAALVASGAFTEMRRLLAPWTVRAVTSYPQVLAAALEAGKLGAADVSQLTRFYADPRRHQRHSGPAAGTALSDLSTANSGETRVAIQDCDISPGNTCYKSQVGKPYVSGP
jgi:hypothetical protein